MRRWIELTINKLTAQSQYVAGLSVTDAVDIVTYGIYYLDCDRQFVEDS